MQSFEFSVKSLRKSRVMDLQYIAPKLPNFMKLGAYPVFQISTRCTKLLERMPNCWAVTHFLFWHLLPTNVIWWLATSVGPSQLFWHVLVRTLFWWFMTTLLVIWTMVWDDFARVGWTSEKTKPLPQCCTIFFFFKNTPYFQLINPFCTCRPPYSKHAPLCHSLVSLKIKLRLFTFYYKYKIHALLLFSVHYTF